MDIEQILRLDPLIMGVKALVYIGDRVLIYRRDDNTTNHPLEIDLPGGGPEPGETPFEVFRRELAEEFSLSVQPGHIAYARRYISEQEPGKFAYYLVARLPPEAEHQIILGEGQEYMLVPVEEYMARKDAWPVMQDRTRDFLETMKP